MLLDKLGPNIALLGQVCNSIGPARNSGLALTRWNVPSTNAFRFSNVRNAKSKSVGKWHEIGIETADENNLKDFESISMASLSSDIPSDISELSRKVRMIKNPALFLMTPCDPQSCLELLDRALPKISVMGIVASHTPFSTGLENTLYHNGEIFSNAVLGIQLESPSPPQLSYPYLEPFGPKVKVTECLGNIILAVDGTNAAQHLLSSLNVAMDTSVTPSDQNLYISLIGTASGEALCPVYRITAGDPTKGALAVDTLNDITVGTQVQFMMPKRVSIPATSVNDGITLNVSYGEQSNIPLNESKDIITSSSLWVSSENGIVVKKPEVLFKRNALNGSYVCDVPYSNCHL